MMLEISPVAPVIRGSAMNETAHILVVDDHREICDVVREYLTEEGYRVSVAHDGDGMRAVIEQSAVDLVLLDVVLPREDGLTLARWLRFKDPNIGIIMLTGRGETMDRIVGLELGADDYLAKPFHLREVLARVKSVCRRIAHSNAVEPATTTHAHFAGWVLDFGIRELRSPAGDSVRLTGASSDCSQPLSPIPIRCSAAIGCSIWFGAGSRGRSTVRSTFR